MLAEEIEKDGKDIIVQTTGILKRFGTGMGFEARVANGERESTGGETGFAKAFAGFLREETEQGFQLFNIVRILAEGVIVGDGFGFGVNRSEEHTSELQSR